MYADPLNELNETLKTKQTFGFLDVQDFRTGMKYRTTIKRRLITRKPNIRRSNLPLTSSPYNWSVYVLH